MLGLLKEAGEMAEGVERDHRLASAARQAGFKVHGADVTDFMRQVTPGHYGAVIASHVVEHVDPEKVPRLFSDASRALKPGGTFVVLTPNPRNIGVITRTFWGDLEHRRPYSVDLLGKLAAEAGFRVVSLGDDPYTRQPGVLHRPLNLLRRVLVGDYWQGADLLLVAGKPGAGSAA